MNQLELFIFPGTRSPQFWSPIRASWKTSPVLQLTVNFLPQTRAHHIDWDHVLGLAVLVGGSALVWASTGMALSHLLR
jgi:hypothetical protein